MKGKFTSLTLCGALLLCRPALAFAQSVPDPEAPPHFDAPPDAEPAAPPARQAAGGALAPERNQAQAPDAQPDLPPPGPPPPANLKDLIPVDQLTFLKDYDQQPTKALVKDKRFKNLMKLAISHTEYHYGRDMSLSDAVQTVLDDSTLAVVVREGRYVSVYGNSSPYLSGRTFLWFDMQTGVALGAFYFHPTNGEPSPTVTVFSRQLTDHDLSMGQLPEPFVDDLQQWEDGARIPQISPRYFIPENGKKYVLTHDEDYCWRPPGSFPADQDACQEMNASAADDDMNAAYFMQETGNVANATAWMLGPDQVAWIGMRDSTCGAGLACRIRITHERTRVLMGHPPAGGRR
jgi:uncharacterized protein YecT (DUF1311 family)